MMIRTRSERPVLQYVLKATALIAMATAYPVSANDSAASIGAGGIQLMREARVSMEKERLTISLQKVVVEYEFLNESDRDVATEVAFPVPPYGNDFVSAAGPRYLDDFRVWTGGQPISYKTDVRAVAKGIDQSAILKRFGVDTATFGHFTDNDPKHPSPYSPEIAKLRRSQRADLQRAGLIDAEGLPIWVVKKVYHWQQTFPSHRTVHVRHEYAPLFGFKPLQLESAPKKTTPDYLQAIRDSCIDEGLQRTLLASARKQPSNENEYIASAWVDYILTTANTWSTPIKEIRTRRREGASG